MYSRHPSCDGFRARGGDGDAISAGEEAIGLHGIPPAQAEPETAVGLTLAQHEHVTAAEEQQAVNHIELRDPSDPEWLTALYCKLHEDGRERQEPALPRPTHWSITSFVTSFVTSNIFVMRNVWSVSRG